jgi:6-phosphofructokinase 1
MPADFIRADGYGITSKARRYLQPLIVGEAPLPYGPDGLPDYATPRFKAVKRKLPVYRIADK